jgi:hypothetical protein
LDEEEHRVGIVRKWKMKTSRNGEEEEEPKIRKLEVMKDEQENR